MFHVYLDFMERANDSDVALARAHARRVNLSARLKDRAFSMSERKFIKRYRLSKGLTRELITELTPHMPPTLRSDALDVETKVLIALEFFATGSYQTVVGDNRKHCVAQASVSKAVRQVIEAINNPVVINKHIAFPFNQNDREQIKRKFYNIFRIPGVLGCIDGTHVAIVCPVDHEERFFNRKGYHSLNVLIICDANMNILCVDPSYPGATHDSVIWANHPLNRYVERLHTISGENVFLLGYKVCPSMDIRNYPESLMRLRNCTVIEGKLSIVLMERATQRSFENMSFPELREVTGYIKIYRMRGLRNLGDLFPNLAVIRGITLFRDYSVVIYDNENLQSLGLRSLVKVERGSVRIERNDKLCYVDTIDWSRIVTGGIENSIIRNNYDTRLCGLCPYAGSRIEDRRSSHKQCPADSSGRLLCWNDLDCQKLCPPACGDRACMDNGACCHYSCAGGCDGPDRHDCHVCRHFSLGYGHNRTCVERCPADTYELLKRCVSEQECRSLTPPPSDSGSGIGSRTYKIFNGTCTYLCPSGYMEEGDASSSTCRPCPKGVCQRECAGGSIDTMAAAEHFRGCTLIKGTLEISLRASGGRTMEELEESLGEIREIEGFLKVVRSHSLVSLGFLKKLRKIGGKDSNGGKKQSLHIFNNPNLELLWNWTRHGDIEIAQGKLFIHFNPKLCYNLIEPLKRMTKDPESTFDELEVSEENNGDQASCYQETLNLRVSMLHRTLVVLTWNKYCLDDTRKLLGYSIYYIVAEHNITQYERRDACYDSWNVQDITDEDALNETTNIRETKDSLLASPCSTKQPMFRPLTKLTPYTRYAAYVKTYTTLQDKRGAQSPIIYFKTLPGKPSQPLKLAVESPEAHAITVKWSPPTTPNGIVNMYRVQVQANSYNRPEITRRSYCDNPSSFHNMITMKETETVDKKKYLPKAKDDATCTCKENESAFGTRFTTQVEAAAESIDFENALQNEVYIKQDRGSRPTGGRGNRSKRSTTDRTLVIVSNYTNPSLKEKPPNVTDADGYVQTAYYELSGSRLSLKVGNLRHFTWYTVSVWACRMKDANEEQDKYEEIWCSSRAHETFRTSELVNADVVTKVGAEIIVSNKTLPEVNVTWEPPDNPNGFVVAYEINYARIDPSTQMPDVASFTCLSADTYENLGHGYLLRSLVSGNYSIKVTPVSMSGLGNVSSEIFVFIPERNTAGYEWVWGVIGGCLVMVLVLGGGVWYARRGLIPDNGASKLFASVNPEYVSTVYVPDEWEVPRASIELVRELGQGSFGMVYEGLAKNLKGIPETRCAVKTVNEHATDKERIEFLNEASVMKAFDTHHVVRLLGVVSRGQPTLVVMELMDQGDLKSYLRSHRPDAENSVPRDRDQPPRQPPSLQQITKMAIEIADGMAYLSAKKFVHRDLAARNCMVAGDLTVKVGDFGMTRDIYETDYYRKGSKGLLPVRWMSPESLKDGVFSSNSDVWSFGVVLWEMVTLAMLPYQGLSNEQVLRYVVDGGVMERPEHCPDRMYELMRACWAHRPALRPSFLQLVARLAPDVASTFRLRSFFHTTQGQELYTQQRRNAEQEEQELTDLNVGAVATGSGSNLFGVSGRLASWVRELSSVRSRGSDDDAAAEPLAPGTGAAAAPRPIPLKSTSTPGPNGVLRDPASTGC